MGSRRATSYALERSGCALGELKGAAVRSLVYLLPRPRPLTGGFGAQPERGYNHAGAGGGSHISPLCSLFVLTILLPWRETSSPYPTCLKRS